MTSSVSPLEQHIRDQGWRFIREYTDTDDCGRKRKFVDYDCICAEQHRKKRACVKSLSNCKSCKQSAQLQCARDLAEAKGGEFLSAAVDGTGRKYLWKCVKGHEFEAIYDNVKQGYSWCRRCNMASVEDMQLLAAAKEGKFLSTAVDGVASKYEWECKVGHKFEATGAKVQQGQWCTDCHKRIYERTCHKIMEFLYDKPFTKIRPQWLTSSEGNRLELDMYNEELQVALEYQGEQHVRRIAYWQTEEKFQRQVRLDAEKVVLCQKHGVHLIIVPHTVKYLDLYAFIKTRCFKLAEGKPEQIDYAILDLYAGRVQEKLVEIERYLGHHFGGGEILSRFYADHNTPLTCRCIAGHDFDQTWSKILHGTFCTEEICIRKSIFNDRITPFMAATQLVMIGEFKDITTAMEWRCLRCNVVAHCCSWRKLRSKQSPMCPCLPGDDLITQ